MLHTGRILQANRPAPRPHSTFSRLPMGHASGGAQARRVVCAAARSHYEVLGVTSSANDQDIKSAFRKLALRLHPDVNKSPGAEESFKACTAAYEVLGDPRQRALYDAELQRKVRSYSQWSTSTSTGAAGRRSRGNRETVFVWEDVEEEDDDDGQAYWGFHTWASTSQSSWKANRKKRARAAAAQAEQARQAQQQQQQQQRQQHPGSSQRSYQGPGSVNLDALLAEMDPATLAGLKTVFGNRLQKLHTIDELVEFLSVVEVLQEEYGMDIEGFTSMGGFSAHQQPPASAGGRRGSSRGSRPSAGHSPPGARADARTRSSRGRSSRSVTLEDLDDLINSVPSSNSRRGAYSAASSRSSAGQRYGHDDTNWAGWASSGDSDDDSDDDEDGGVTLEDLEELTAHDVHVLNSMHSWFGEDSSGSAWEDSSRDTKRSTSRRQGGNGRRRR